MQATIIHTGKPHLRFRPESFSRRSVAYIVLAVFAILNLYPIVWMIMNSFKTEKEIALNPLAPPTKLVLDNYVKAWQTAQMGRYMLNSLIVSTVATLITVMAGAFAAYFISRFRFRGRDMVYTLFIFGMLIPVHSMLIPLFIIMRKIDLLNRYWALIFPYIAFNLPLTIYLMVSYMSALPREVEEAALIDGAGTLRIFASIIIPMSGPIVATCGILNFINNWNEFVFALVLINNPDLKTLPLGLANFVGQYVTSYGPQMAGITIVMLPIIIVYLLLEKYVVSGMTAGAVKG